MSKTLGNSPDPIELIKKYGADGVRVGMLLCAPAGNDIPFDEGLCEQGRNFSNKIWNAFRLIKGWEVSEKEQPLEAKQAVKWFNSRIGTVLEEINDSFTKFRLSEALMSSYKLIWDDLCSSYLEAVKPAYGGKIDPRSLKETIEFFETTLKIIHPFMPFLSEEIWHRLADRPEKEDALIVAKWPEQEKGDELLQREWEVLSEILSDVKNQRNQYGISPKEALTGSVNISGRLNQDFSRLFKKLGNCTIDIISDGGDTSPRKNGVVSLDLGDKLQEEEKKNLEKELEYSKGFAKSVEKKLSDSDVLLWAHSKRRNSERKKLADALAKISQIEEKLEQMK